MTIVAQLAKCFFFQKRRQLFAKLVRYPVVSKLNSITLGTVNKNDMRLWGEKISDLRMDCTKMLGVV